MEVNTGALGLAIEADNSIQRQVEQEIQLQQELPLALQQSNIQFFQLSNPNQTIELIRLLKKSEIPTLIVDALHQVEEEEQVEVAAEKLFPSQ